MREFLHFFGIHHWDKWLGLEVIYVKEITLFGSLEGNTYAQKRSCTLCKKIQVRRLI